MFEYSGPVKPICKRCGHEAGYHGTTYCQRTEDGYGKVMEQRRVCDCPGWERDHDWGLEITTEPAPEADLRGHASLVDDLRAEFDQGHFMPWEAIVARIRADLRGIGLDALAAKIAAHLWMKAPPKIEGGSPPRAQWIADVLAVQMAFHEVGSGEVFQAAMNTDARELEQRTTPEPEA